MNKGIRQAVFARSKGRCECGCEKPITFESGHADHFFGRAKAEESVDTVWFLALHCDELKTTCRPSSIHWCRLFFAHARKHGYQKQMERVEAKARVLIAKGFGGARA